MERLVIRVDALELDDGRLDGGHGRLELGDEVTETSLVGAEGKVKVWVAGTEAGGSGAEKDK